MEVKNLKTYFYTDEGVVRAVDGIDFVIKKGETLGMIGESGCGKSVTALSIIQLVDSPPGRIIEGEIWFEEEDENFKSLVQFSESDLDVFLAIWDSETFKCLQEIALTPKTFSHLYKFTAGHKLGSD